VTVERLVRQIQAYPATDQAAAVERLAVHDDPDLRSRAAEVAARLNHPQLTGLCVGLLSDPVWYVRCSACACIGMSSVAVPAGLLLGLVESDPHEIVRSYAALALGRVAGADDVQRMLAVAEVAQGENHEGTPVRDILLRSVDEVCSRV